MLVLSSLYCLGHVATPVIEACEQHGLFKLLDSCEFRARAWLITELDANPGYFAFSFEVCDGLGWLEKNTTDKCDVYQGRVAN